MADEPVNNRRRERQKMLLKSSGQNVLVSIVISGLLALNIQADETKVLHEGTPVRMKINRTLSSASAQQGENVDFQTLEEIKLSNTVIIPGGSTAIGTVTEAEPKGHMGKGGKLSVNIDYLRLPNGEKLPLRGVQELKGGGHGGAMTGGMIATAIVFWPAAPLFLFMHGKDISIPEGHEFTVYTSSDFKPTSMNIAADARPVGAGATLHTADVLTLIAGGMSEQIIVAKIKSAPGVYELGANDLLRLKAAGVSDSIIGAMISAPTR